MDVYKKLKLKTYEDRSFIKKFLAKYRVLTYKKRALPDFLILGTQKGGTTSLYRYIATHPNIKPNYVVKELSFFDELFSRGIPWYKSNFPIRKKHYLYYEGTTHYLFNPNCALRVSEILPNCKFIVLLRNPVSRAFSSYKHQVRAGREKLSFEDAVSKEKERLKGEKDKLIADKNYFSYNYQHFSYLERGKYAEQIKIWFKYFPKSSFLFLKSEEFYRDTQKSLEEVCEFLEIKKIKFNVKKKFNSVPYNEKISDDVKHELEKFFKSHNEELKKLIGKSFTWK